jgi:Tfp pilus assembly protein PilO
MLEKLERQARPQTLVGSAGSLVGLTLLAGALYAVKPSVVAYREAGAARLEAREEALARGAATNDAVLADAERELVELRDRLYGEGALVEPAQREAHVIETLDRAALRFGVELTAVAPGRPTEVIVFQEQPYDLRVIGDYFALFAWLGEVQRELRPMTISRLEIAPIPPARVELRLRLVAYRRGESA